MNLQVVLPILVVMAALAVFRASLLVWLAAWWAGMYVALRWGMTTPIPSSALQLYMSLTTLALAAYATSSTERLRAVADPLRAFATERRWRVPLVIVAIALPALAAWRAYAATLVPIEPPFFARTVHPSPPTTIVAHGETIDMVKGDNPLAPLEQSNAPLYRQHVENGKRIYYQNCFYCHGDDLAGQGPFAHALNPIPANFRDQGVLPNFQVTFFFWRIAKGGPGMPDEGAPGDSAMPEWERFLSNEEIWDVVAFLYDFTGYRPRALEEISH